MACVMLHVTDLVVSEAFSEERPEKTAVHPKRRVAATCVCPLCCALPTPPLLPPGVERVPAYVHLSRHVIAQPFMLR